MTTPAADPPRPGWRDRVLAEFPTAAGELCLVGDPDGVLKDEPLQTALLERGYELVAYEDPMVFRGMYERRWRAQIEGGRPGHSLIVWLGVPPAKLANGVPFDLLSHGRRIHLSLGRLFPQLAPSVLAVLGTAQLDRLWDAVVGDDAATRGPDSTADLVLRKVFGLDPDAVIHAKVPANRLLTQLLPMHFAGLVLPELLAERARARLASSYALARWPIPALLDRAAFLAFLQRRWAAWVHRLVYDQPDRVADRAPFGGEPDDLDVPFHDTEVGAWLDTYFLNGLLVPVSVPAEVELPRAPPWLALGVEQDPRRDAEARLSRVLDAVVTPGEASSWTEWTRLALGLAEASALAAAAELKAEHPLQLGLAARLREADEALLPWLQRRYGGLATLPHHDAPAMVHQVPRFMAERLGSSGKVALLVLDGLALDQWARIRAGMPPISPRLLVDDGATFAWIPTLTNVSRQAIFAGEPPYAFPTSIYTTSGEERWWRRFWEARGVLAGQARYLGVVDPAQQERLDEVIQDEGVRVLGAVIGLVDNLIHEWPLPRAALLPTLHRWAQDGHLSRLIGALLDAGFEVFLTSDHGNTDAVGLGAPSDGKLPDIRGQRVRVYPNDALRDAAATQHPDAVRWAGYGLPDDFQVLLALRDAAFAPAGERLVCHGGVSLLELIVPFVHFRKGAP